MFPSNMLPRPFIDVENLIRTFQQSLAWRAEEDRYSFNLIVPGLDSNEIDLKVQKNQVVVSIQKNDQFKKTVQMGLPDDADEQNISAHLSKGVLTVSVPKALDKQPRSIEIQSA